MNRTPARHQRRGLALVALLLGLPMGTARSGDPAEDCAVACRERAVAEAEACFQRTGDKDACYAELEARVLACVRDLCTDPPPPELRCEDRCHRAFEERIRKCETLGPEADLTEEECRDAAHRALDECIQGCVEPPPPSCRDLCKARAQEAYERCRAADGTERECLAAMEAAALECIRANCETEPPPEPRCEDRCHRAFEERLLACQELGADGSPDGAIDPECEQAAHEALRLCMEGCMEPPPPPVPCEDRCVALHQRLLDELLQSGEEPDRRKLEEIELTFQRCLESCIEPPPPPGETCESRCLLLGEEIRSRCLRADGSLDEECLARLEAEAEAAVARCLRACGEPPPPPEPTCKERCALHAREVLQACREQNGSPEDCEAAYRQALEECVAESCPPVEPPPELPCEERCERHARSILDACLENGGREEDCKARMAEAFRRCALGCAEPPPPEPPCEVACEEKVVRFLEQCLRTSDDGVIVGEDGIAATCEEEAHRMLERCRSGCGDEGEPPPEPPPCDERCVAQAEAAFQACVEAGGDPDRCRQRVDGILSLCLERCGAPEPCEDRCALAAQIVMEGCALGGLPSEQCKRLANVVLEGCVSACNPPLGCEERCAEVVQRALRECRAQGGTEEECDALRTELEVSCLARCGGEPLPPCEVQCEEKADAMAAACVEKGLSERECAAERDRFLKQCQELHSESCVEEIQADLTVFRSFLRGDANRDRSVDVTDPIFVLNYLFVSGEAPPCEDAADANDDGRVDISDPITTLRHLFLGSETLPEPSSREGQDGTSDALVCAE